MSNGEWTVLGLIDEINYFFQGRAVDFNERPPLRGFHNHHETLKEVEEFNKHAPYGLEHRRMAFLQLSPEQVEQISTPVLGEVAREEIKRLFKPWPALD